MKNFHLVSSFKYKISQSSNVQQQLILNNKMCFSDSKVNSRETKESFKQMVDIRTNYTNGKQLSKFLICMLEYMEKILQGKVGIRVTKQKSFFSCLPCCGDDYNYRNVRKEFQKSYEGCNSMEQLQYYRDTVHFMTGKPISTSFAQPKTSLPQTESMIIPQQNQGQQLAFQAETKGKLGWSSGYTMKLNTQKHTILLISPSEKETLINLRNYILRVSKLSKQNSYVLSGIVPADPFKVRFAISQKNKDRLMIIKKLKEQYMKGIEQNVKSWIKPVTHITNIHNTGLNNRKPGANIFQGNNQNQQKQKSVQEPKKQVSPQIRITASINNPLKNKIMDKAKVGLIKKTFEYKQQTLSKQDKQSANNMPSERNTLKLKQNDKNPEFLLDGNNTNNRVNQQQSPATNLLTIMNLGSPNSTGNNSKNDNKQDDAFKKKPKSPLSYNSAKSPQPIAPKRKPSVIRPTENYAQQPQETRSDSGLLVQRKNVDLINKEIDKDLDKMDSGKSLIHELDHEVILEEEEFGNISEISGDTSFQTIPEPGGY